MNANDKVILRWFFYFDLLKQLLLEITNPSITNPTVNCVTKTTVGIDCIAIIDYKNKTITTLLRDEQLNEIERICLSYEEFVHTIWSIDNIVVEPLYIEW